MSARASSRVLKAVHPLWRIRALSTESGKSTRPPIQEQGPDGRSYYWDTIPPTDTDLDRASLFFRCATPTLSWSTDSFHKVGPSKLGEVVFLGRSNVGKSSLINALLGRNVCPTSQRPGRTRKMNCFTIEAKAGRKLSLLDMPGYGKNSREEWGKEIVKYLTKRRQLKRAFLLIDPRHGLKPLDHTILRLFRAQGIPHQIILNKIDCILFPQLKDRVSLQRDNVDARASDRAPQLAKFVEDLREQIQPGTQEGPEALGEVISCSAETLVYRGRGKGKGVDRYGINAVRWAVLSAVGLAQEPRRLDPSLLAPSDSEAGNDNVDEQPEIEAEMGAELEVEEEEEEVYPAKTNERKERYKPRPKPKGTALPKKRRLPRRGGGGGGIGMGETPTSRRVGRRVKAKATKPRM